MKSILIVEDESLVALELSETVSGFGHNVIGICSGAAEAVRLADTLRPDVILMDIRLKGENNGIEAAKEILALYRPFVVFLTAYSDRSHIEAAMQLQPQGYLIKPVKPQELYALLVLAEKQSARTVRGDVVLDETFSLDTATVQLIRNGRFVSLTRKERQLLMLLIEHRNGIVSTYEIENRIWPEKAPNENTRRSLIRRLRAKLDNRFIDTIPGEGYRITF